MNTFKISYWMVPSMLKNVPNVLNSEFPTQSKKKFPFSFGYFLVLTSHKVNLLLRNLLRRWNDCKLEAVWAQSHWTEGQQTAAVMASRADRDGRIDRRPHMQTCLLINSCWQRANTLGSLAETSVMLPISLHAFQVGCPQPVTVG